MREKAERIAEVAIELGAARALVQQKEAELRALLASFASDNQLEPLHPLPPERRLPIRRENHGEMVPKLLLAMKTELLSSGNGVFDAACIAHIMDCTEQVAKIRLRKAYVRGHLDRPEPGKYTPKVPIEPDLVHEETR
jgi:hypothetical protein